MVDEADDCKTKQLPAEAEASIQSRLYCMVVQSRGYQRHVIAPQVISIELEPPHLRTGTGPGPGPGPGTSKFTPITARAVNCSEGHGPGDGLPLSQSKRPAPQHRNTAAVA